MTYRGYLVLVKTVKVWVRKCSQGETQPGGGGGRCCHIEGASQCFLNKWINLITGLNVLKMSQLYITLEKKFECSWDCIFICELKEMILSIFMSFELFLEILYRDTCTLMFTLVLFTIAKSWNQPRCPSADKWIKKMWWCFTSFWVKQTRLRKTNIACFLSYIEPIFF
jgi:hypothetical protein